MSLLTKLWEDKIRSKRQERQIAKLKGYKPYTVQWDHPDYKRGEKVTRQGFETIDEAREYAIQIGLEYDLRRHEGVIQSLDPKLSRYQSGYTPMATEAEIPFVMPCIQTQGGMPLEVSDREVELYKEKHGLPTVGRHILKKYPEAPAD